MTNIRPIGIIVLLLAGAGRSARPQAHDAAPADPVLPVRSVAFSPDGKWLAGGCIGAHGLGPGAVRLWDVATGQLRRTLAGHRSHVYSVAFSPDGTRLASSSGPPSADRGAVGEIILWDVASGKQAGRITRIPTWIRSLAFDPSGGLLAGAVELPNQDDGFAVNRSHGEVVLWQVSAGAVLRTLPSRSGPVYSVAISPDGKTIAGATAVNNVPPHILGEVQQWELGSGKPIRTLDCPGGPVYSVAFSPDGTLIGAGGYGQTVHVWNAGTGKLVRALPRHSAPVWCVAFSPKDDTLAAGSGCAPHDLNQGEVRLWNVATGQEVRCLKEFPNTSCLAFSPGGETLANGGNAAKVTLCDPASGRTVRIMARTAGERPGDTPPTTPIPGPRGGRR